MKKILSFCKKFFLLGSLMGISFFVVSYFNLASHLHFSKLQDTYVSMHAFTDEHPFLAPLFFIILYVVTALSTIPGLLMLEILAGMFFFELFAALYITVGGIVSSLILYLSVRKTKFEWKNPKILRMIGKVETFLQKRGSLYLCLIRLFPFFPFWLVSVVMSLIKVRPLQFLWTSTLGIFMIGMIMSLFGSSLKDSLESEAVTLKTLMGPKLIAAAIFFSAFMILFFVLAKKKLPEKIEAAQEESTEE